MNMTKTKIIVSALLCCWAVVCGSGYAVAKDLDSHGRCVIYTDIDGLETTAGAASVTKRSVRLLKGAASASDLEFVEQNPTVDLLICCDAGAMAALNNRRKTVETFAQETVDRMNMILHNNGLDEHFKFRCSGCTALKTKFSDIIDGLGIKRGKGDNGVALALKEATGADIIVCVNGGGGAIGVAYGVTYTDQEQIARWGKNAGNPIASVYVGSAMDGYVTSHEVGHVMGAGHSHEEKGPQSTPYSAGLHFEMTNRQDVANASAPFTNYYYTVMAYNGATGSDGNKHVYTAVPYYTDSTKTWTPDPDVFDPVPIGDEEEHDNARVLRDNCKSVASWRERVLPYDGDVRAYDSNGAEIFHGRAFAYSLTVSLSSPVEGATIRYTLDGTKPTSSSAEYVEPFAVADTTTITACAVQGDKAYGLRTFKVMKLGVEPIVPARTDVAWQTDPTNPWHFDGTALRSAYAANSWLRAKITGPKRLSFYYSATIGGDAQFDLWVNGISKLRVTESTTGYTSATVDLPEGENDVVFFYRHGGYFEDNKVYVQDASLEDIAPGAAAIPVAKPVAVWNGDFVHNEIRGPVRFNANNNTVAADRSRVSRVNGKGAIAFNVSAGSSVLAVAGTTDLATGTANGKGTPKAVITIPTSGHTSLDGGFGTQTTSTDLMRFGNGASVANYSSVQFPRKGFHTFAFGATSSGALCYLDGNEVFDDSSYGLSGNIQAVYIGAGGGGSFPTVTGDLNYIAIFTNATVSVNDAKNWMLKNMTVPLTLSSGGDLGAASLGATTGLNLAGGAYTLATAENIAALLVQDDSSIDFTTLDATLGGGKVLYVADGKSLTVNVTIDADTLKDQIDAAYGVWRHQLINGANYGDVTAGSLPDLGARYVLDIEQTETGGVYLTGERKDVVYVDDSVGGETDGNIVGAIKGNITLDYHYGNAGEMVYDTGAASGSIVGGFVLSASGAKVVQGDTLVALQLPDDASGSFAGNIIGASLGGGCDCGTGETQNLPVMGSSSVAIDAPNSVTFSGTICGGGYLRMPVTQVYGLGTMGASAASTVGVSASVAIAGGTYTGTLVAGGYKDNIDGYSLTYANVGIPAASLTIAGGVFNGATLMGYSPSFDSSWQSNDPTATLAFTGRTDLLGEVTISGFDTITIAEGVFVKVESETTQNYFRNIEGIMRREVGGAVYMTSTATSLSAMPTELVEYAVPAGTTQSVGAGETVSAARFIVNGTLSVAGTLEGDAIAGSGEVVFKGKTPDALDWTSDDWAGIVTLSGTKNLSGVNPSQYCKMKFIGSSGNLVYATYATEVIFEDGSFGYAFDLTGSDSSSVFNNISGTGTIVDSAESSGRLVFEDAARFSGSIKSNGGNSAFVFGSGEEADAAMPFAGGTITVLSDGHAVIGVDKVWAPSSVITVKSGGIVELLGAATFEAPATFETGAKLIIDDFSSASYDSDALLTFASGVSGTASLSFGAGVVSLAADTCLIAWPGTAEPPVFTPDAAANALAAACQVEFATETDGLYLRAIPFANDDSVPAGYYTTSSEYGKTYVVVTNASGAVTIGADVGWAEYHDLDNAMSLTVEYDSTDDLELRLKNCAWCVEYEKDGALHTLDVKSAYRVTSLIQPTRTIFTLTLTGKNEAGEDATVNVDGVEIKVTPELDLESESAELEISATPKMTVRTIPGFWYEIVTDDKISGAFSDAVDGTKTQATTTSTTLVAPSEQSGDKRFYRVRVGESSADVSAQ